MLQSLLRPGLATCQHFHFFLCQPKVAIRTAELFLRWVFFHLKNITKYQRYLKEIGAR
ncbi:MAG: hypothetical protein UY98_C0030G0005 [Candidatus Kaiserbacteria bacterium GW2011_GWA2_58_9]|uniref:Uncharacterized protein n=1 Tax=Candidatus Kaiserbacteria bacterium GW2011_GWA2_58_9 TaxID=1618672 RepID=A0A0G2AXL5_9BACT|nr:MAG: hypothetical protein UY98_C0030G0005 [Candidatus Kaiserbacteria bacterium GW2011_GWA2_58_9]